MRLHGYLPLIRVGSRLGFGFGFGHSIYSAYPSPANGLWVSNPRFSSFHLLNNGLVTRLISALSSRDILAD